MLLKKEVGSKSYWERVSNSLVYVYDNKVLITVTDNIAASFPSYTMKVFDRKGRVAALFMGDDAIQLQEKAFSKLKELKIKHEKGIVTEQEML